HWSMSMSVYTTCLLYFCVPVLSLSSLDSHWLLIILLSSLLKACFQPFSCYSVCLKPASSLSTSAQSLLPACQPSSSLLKACFQPVSCYPVCLKPATTCFQPVSCYPVCLKPATSLSVIIKSAQSLLPACQPSSSLLKACFQPVNHYPVCSKPASSLSAGIQSAHSLLPAYQSLSEISQSLLSAFLFIVYFLRPAVSQSARSAGNIWCIPKSEVCSTCTSRRAPPYSCGEWGHGV
uniref:Uncharacterized protein n=1 Tax=Cyprinodon variegatus TaxID=28743 RepID=A0A3Q2E8F8_CYPVA